VHPALIESDCTPQQTSTEALAFLDECQQLSDVMSMGKQQTPPPKQSIFFDNSACPVINKPNQTANGYNNDKKFKSGQNGSKCGIR